MRRIGLVCTIVACSGGGGSTGQYLGGTLGSTHDVSGIHSQYGKTGDAALAARLAFANPGGMWMPQQMTMPAHAAAFKKLGVELDPKKLADPLADPLGAIVSLGGCTGSFVSADGLIATNHHCVQTALKVNSTKDSNLVDKGFLAKTRADEKSAGHAQRVYVAQAFRDVTKEIREGLDTIKDAAARHDEIEKREKVLLAACEKDRPEIRCKVSSYDRGDQYVLTENLEIRDVRLVYAPPRSIGNYGGEEDNWAWPRHTGDFSFVRAYVGKDGKPALFAADNVPYHPKHVLKVSTAGVKQGDFVMVTGYPGSTSRTKTLRETKHYVDWYLPYAIEATKARYELAKQLGDGDGETAIKARVAKQRTQNRLAKMEGQVEALGKGDLMLRKAGADKLVMEWADKPEHEVAKAALTRLDQVLAEAEQTARADYDRTAAFDAAMLMETALHLVHWADERAKKDADRKSGFQERDLQNAASKVKQFARDYDRTYDRALFKLELVRALALPEAERAWLALLLDTKKNQKIDEALIDKTLDAWYRTQQLEDEKLRHELLTKGTMATLKASKDPFIKAALRVWPVYKAEEKRDDARAGELALLAPAYVRALREVSGGVLAPDANGTLRITYGTIRSFKPDSKAATDRPFTLASQIPAKNTGAKDFDAPKSLLDAIKAKTFGPYADADLGGDQPVDFLSDLDITNGNSGSPTLDRKGQLVGLAFDGTTAGVASDIVFDEPTTRTISVDARYMAFVMDLIDGADALLVEMGIQPKLKKPAR